MTSKKTITAPYKSETDIGRIIFGSLFLFCLLLATVPANAASPEDLLRNADSKAPWHITADEVQHDQEADTFIANGNVVIKKEDIRISADSIQFNRKKMTLVANGNVAMATGSNVLTGRQIEMDLRSETGVLYHGNLFIAQNHFYISGDEIRKVGKDTYKAENATVTTCDGDSPDWKITARKLNLTIEGYGTAEHATFRVRQVPVMYTPYLLFPLKIKRQTGLLVPQFGYSKRKGAEINLPLFWAISDSTDATFYGNYMSSRGLKGGAEYRYVLDPQSRGTVMGDYLNDNKIDDGQPENTDKWGYAGDGELRLNEDRWWFRMKNNQALPLGVSGKLDLDVVSDQDYLQEFRTGYSGFEETRAEFLNVYGRDIDDYTESTRLNRLNLSRLWSRYSLNADARYYYDTTDSGDNLHMLPLVLLEGAKQPLLGSSFFYDLETEYAYFYQKEGGRGHRGDVYPRLYYPYTFGPYLTVEPSAGVRATTYYIDTNDSTQAGSDGNQYRTLYDFKLDASTEIYRVLPLRMGNMDRMRHTARFQAVYDYISDVDQTNLPNFDSKDRIAKQNLITYSWTNTFTSRFAKPSARTSPEKTADLESSQDESGYAYNPFCRLQLTQSYDIDKANQNDPEPFSSIFGILEVNPVKYFSMRSEVTWSPYDGAFDRNNLGASVWDTRGDRIFGEYRYSRDTNETFYADGILKVTDRVSVLGEYEYNMIEKKLLKAGVGALYTAGCWSLDVRYIEEGTDRAIEFTVNLFGLGGLGSGVGIGSQ